MSNNEYNSEQTIQIIQIIKNVFPESVIERFIENNFKGLKIKILKKRISKNIFENFFGLFKKELDEDENKICFEFNIYDKEDYIFIKRLNKCDIIKGGEFFLNNINILAKTLKQSGLKINRILLEDDSYVTICKEHKSICLRTIKILTTGESWYNSYGYYSRNKINEKISNKKIIEKKYTNFLIDLKKSIVTINYEKSISSSDEVIKFVQSLIDAILKEPKNKENKEKLIKYRKEIYDYQLSKKQQKSLYKRFIQYNEDIQDDEDTLLLKNFKKTDIKTLFPNLAIDVNTITVKNFFNNIWTYIKDHLKDCENEDFIKQFIWLVDFVKLIKKSGILIYTVDLQKEINTEDLLSATKYLKKGYYKKYIKYKNKYLNLKNQLG
jgi:hypothetical protein